MDKKKFSVKQRIQSFSFAIQGIKLLLRHEHNARIHLVATVLVLVLGFLYKITATEWMMLVLAICMVWITEALNTAIEYICNKITIELNPQIKIIKDVAAAAVLIAALGAVAIGFIIFLPLILQSL